MRAPARRPDDGPSRRPRGFPLQVANELATLRDHYFRLHHHGKSAWEHVEMGR